MYWLTALVLLLVVGIVVAYNRLIRSRNRVDAAWSDIDVQLQRRHDLVPQLVAAVRQYAAYERATLEAVSELRKKAMQPETIAERGATEARLGDGIGHLIVNGARGLHGFFQRIDTTPCDLIGFFGGGTGYFCCTLHRIHPWDYLNDALQKLIKPPQSGPTEKLLQELLPQNWAKANPDKIIKELHQA